MSDAESALSKLTRASSKTEFADAQEDVERALRRLATLEDCSNFDFDTWNELVERLRATQDEVHRRCLAVIDAKCRFLYKRLEWNPELHKVRGYGQELSFPNALKWQQERGFRPPRVDEVTNLYFAVRDGSAPSDSIPQVHSSHWLDMIVESHYNGRRIFYQHPRGVVSESHNLVLGPDFSYEDKVEVTLDAKDNMIALNVLPDELCEFLFSRRRNELPLDPGCVLYLHQRRDHYGGPRIEGMATNFFFNSEEGVVHMWVQAELSQAYTKGVRLKDNKNT